MDDSVNFAVKQLTRPVFTWRWVFSDVSRADKGRIQ
jgi:hypothetical protein